MYAGHDLILPIVYCVRRIIDQTPGPFTGAFLKPPALLVVADWRVPHTVQPVLRAISSLLVLPSCRLLPPHVTRLITQSWHPISANNAPSCASKSGSGNTSIGFSVPGGYVTIPPSCSPPPRCPSRYSVQHCLVLTRSIICPTSSIPDAMLSLSMQWSMPPTPQGRHNSRNCRPCKSSIAPAALVGQDHDGCWMARVQPQLLPFHQRARRARTPLRGVAAPARE